MAAVQRKMLTYAEGKLEKAPRIMGAEFCDLPCEKRG
jgi:hypothetical protein